MLLPQLRKELINKMKYEAIEGQLTNHMRHLEFYNGHLKMYTGHLEFYNGHHEFFICHLERYNSHLEFYNGDLVYNCQFAVLSFISAIMICISLPSWKFFLFRNKACMSAHPRGLDQMGSVSGHVGRGFGRRRLGYKVLYLFIHYMLFICL